MKYRKGDVVVDYGDGDYFRAQELNRANKKIIVKIGSYYDNSGEFD